MINILFYLGILAFLIYPFVVITAKKSAFVTKEQYEHRAEVLSITLLLLSILCALIFKG